MKSYHDLQFPFGKERRWEPEYLFIPESLPICLHSIAESRLKPGWKYLHESSLYNVFEIPLNGTLTVENYDGTMHIPPGSGIFLPANEYNRLSYQGKDVMHKLAFSFHGTLAQPMMMALLGFRRMIHFESIDFVWNYFKEFRDIFDTNDAKQIPCLAGKTMEFLTAVAFQQERTALDERITLANDFIFTHFHQKVQSDKLAKSLNISNYQLKKLFKNQLHTTPGKYVFERKMELAMRLLRSSNMTVNAIAIHLGYTSAFAFSNVFKKHTGHSPRLWRQIHANEINK